jgi:hypothetical protein
MAPITLPDFPTWFAAKNTSIPVPEPRSTMVSPSLILASFVGAPHPTPSKEAFGMESISPKTTCKSVVQYRQGRISLGHGVKIR